MRLTTKYSFFLPCVVLLLLYDTDKTLASGSSCRTGCSGSSNSLIKLDEGTTYVYNLEGLTETSLPKSKGPNGESVKLSLKAKVEVTALPQCATLIKLKGVQVTGPDNKKHANLDKLEAHPLLVSLNGGRLDSEVCASPDDDYTSLNIKRAVASLFQANTNEDGGSSNEVDVFGSCSTDFTVRKDGDVVIVQKRRNLNYCKYREGLQQLWFSVPHGHSSDSQTTPLLEPDFESEQKIQNKILESAVVKESYLFKPFANRDNGARTKVVTKLTLESKSGGAAPAHKNNQPRSIIFENPHDTTTSSLGDVKNALQKVVDSVGEAVPTTAAHDFENLVELVRHATKDDLISIYGNAKSGAGFKNKDLAKKVFIDALFQARSAESVSVAIELLKNHEIEGILANAWYLSFAFVRHTNAASLASAASLLDEPKLPHAAYLGVGALAGQYCREHVCDSVPELNQLLSKLAKIIENPTKEKEHNVLAALKGLKNAKHLNDDAANKVIQIAKDNKVSTRVRVAALEAAKGDACRGKVQKAAGDILANREEDSELRIKAYLVLVECPNSKIATKLNELLESETVNQVGAFITSHLRNLRASVNPDRENAREILYNVRPKRKFPIDIRKFSHNHEISQRFDALSSSASLESNVIYSQKSYLPRSANLNLTAEVFGQAFNLFEINGRAENLDKVVERIFGPKGYLRTHKPEEIIKEGKEGFTKWRDIIGDKLRNTVRGKRSVTKQQTDAFGSKVKLYNNELDKNIDVDLSLSLLGNELVWFHLDDEKAINPNKILDELSNLVNKELGKIKDFNHDLKNHYHFLDTQLSYPTATGLPLKLTAHGSAVGHVKLGGSLDFGTILKDPKNGEFRFKVIPSASVEVIGALSVDAYAVEAGLKVVGNLHTATGTDIHLKLLDGHGFDLNIGLPVQKSDVLTVSSEVVATVRERGHSPVDHKLEFNLPRKDFHGCFDQLQTIVGLTFCSDVGFPMDQQPLVTNAALYPLNGHSKLSVHVDKEESLKSYHVKFYFNIDDPKNRKLEIKINTPGTQTQRELSLVASAVTEPNRVVSVHFVSPIHDFSVEGAIVENDKEYSISGSVKLDKNDLFKARLGVLINGATYTPVLEYTPVGGNQIDVKVEGTVTVNKDGAKRKYTFNNVRVIANKVTYSVDGTILKDTDSFTTDLKLGYDKNTIGVKSKIQRQGERNLKINAEVTPSQYPDFSFALKYEYQRDDTHVENSLIFVHGPDLKSKHHRLTIFQQTHYKGQGPTNFDVSTKNTLTYPVFEIEGKFDAAATKKSVSYDLELSYAKQKFKSKLNAKTSVNKFGDYEISFLAGVADKEIIADAKREILDTYKSKFTNKLEVKPGGKYELNGEVTHQFKPNDINGRLIGQLILPDIADDYKVDIALITNPAVFDGHTKIAAGPNEYIHAVLKFTRKAPLSGNFKLNVRNVIDSNGDYKYGGGKGNGAALVHVLPLKRKIKGSADLNVAGSKHTGVIEILWDADKDNNKKLHIETDTDLTKSSINSKNKLKLLDKQLAVNFHGDREGKPGNGKVSGGFDVTIPSGRVYTGKFKEALQIVPSASNLEFFIELATAEKQGAHPTKIFLDTYAKNVDTKRYQADTKVEAGYECHAGKHVYSQTLISKPQDGKLNIDFQNSLTGVGDKPIHSKGNVVLGRPDSSYTVAIVVGEYTADSTGKYHREHNHFEAEHKTEIKTPLEILKRLFIKDKRHFHKGDETIPYQASLNEEIIWNDKTFKLEGSGEVHHKQGFVKGSTLLPGSANPISIDASYKHEHAANEVRKAEVNFKANYDKDKNVDWNIKSDYTKDLGLVSGHIIGKTPYESIKTVDLQVTYKKLSDVSRSTDVKLVLNGQKVDGYAKVDLTQNHPLIDVTFNGPSGKSRFYYKLDRKSERQAESEGQIIWVRNGGGQIDYNSKIDLESLDNFIVTAYVNSEKLNVNKLKLELGNRLTKGGAAKRINFSAQTADKKGVSGSVSYAVKESDVGFTIDGKGNLEIQNEKHPLTYKAVFKRLSRTTDKEVGTSFTLTADYGKGKLELTHKITDKEFNYKANVCYNGCALFEVKSKLDIIDYIEVKHEALFTYENSMNGRSDSVTIGSKTHRRGLYVDHETKIKNKDVKYGLKSHLHEQDAAVNIELPSREIEAKASYELPLIGKKQNAPNTFTAKFDGSLALDKKKAPKEVARFVVLGELTTAQKAASATSEIKFSHPSLEKDMVIRAKASAGLEKRVAEASAELDIFNKKNQKVTASARVDHERIKNGHKYTVGADFVSKGLTFDFGSTAYAYSNAEEYSAGAKAYYSDDKGVKKEYGASVEGNPTHFLGIVNVPNKQLAKLEANVKVTKEQQSVEIEFDDLNKPAVFKFDLIGYKIIKGSAYHKNNPGHRLEGKIELGAKQLEVKVEKAEDPAKINLFSVVINFDDAKPIYEINSENIKKVIEEMKKNADNSVVQYREVIKVLTEELLKELRTILETFKKATPNLKPLLDKYKAQFEAIRNELEQDPEFKKLAEVLRKIIGGLMEAFEERTKKVIEIFSKLQQEVAELQEKIIASYNKILPDVTKTYEKLLQSATTIFQRFTELATQIASRILEIIRQNDADIKQVVASLSETFQGVSKASLGTINRLRHEIEDFIKLVLDQIKAMPIYSEIKDKYGDLANLELPEQFWNFYSEFTFAVEDFLPTDELKALVKSIFQYIEKRLKKQQVDDAAAIRTITENAVSAFRSILRKLRAENVLDDPSDYLRWDLSRLPLPFGLGGRLPLLKSLGDLSILRHLKSLSDLPSAADYYYTYRPTLNPLDYVPPYRANAYILHSHHFFTFDRKHVAFKGSCSYILAQDFLDGNFSIVANLENGKLKSLTVNDRTDSVEWLHDNRVTVNGKTGDFPVNHNDFNGWQEYGSSSIKNKAGIWIKKYHELDLIIVQVSGFYFGRTRGLLGTINNEQYDEFTLPNGHIAKDGAEFANAYKVVDSCAAVTELKHTGNHAPECTKFFTSDSSLRSSYPYINPDIYREACDQHVAMSSSDKLKAACEVVSAYVYALKREHVPLVSLPLECAKCHTEGKTVEYGHPTSFTSPNGKADVIFVVEQSSHNSPVFKELVTPLITTLSQDLKEKGLGDVEFAVIGFGGPDQKWPQIYGNNGKFTYGGKGDNIVFGESEKLSPPFDTLEKKIKLAYKYYKIEFGKEQIVFAMNTANTYPFRQGAAKIIVLVHSTPCSKSPIFPVSLQLLRILEIRKFYRDHGLNFHIISPLAGLTVANAADQKTKNIVGFDSEKIYTLGDAKKKPLEGDATDRPKLDFQSDLCLDFSQDYGGAAYSSQNFLDSKPDQRKKFVHVVSQRIVQGATAYKYTEDCTCTLYKGVYPYPECKVSSKEHAR